jgi:dihydrofolate reductase
MAPGWSAAISVIALVLALLFVWGFRPTEVQPPPSLRTDPAPFGIVSLQVAGSAENANEILESSSTGEFADVMNDMPTFVASTTLSEPLEWKNSTLLKGDVAEAVRELKEGDGKAIQVIGSGELAQTLMANDLVDEYRLMVYPVVLGAGKRLFREGGPRIALKLVDGSITPKRVQILTYRPERQE